MAGQIIRSHPEKYECSADKVYVDRIYKDQFKTTPTPLQDWCICFISCFVVVFLVFFLVVLFSKNFIKKY